MAIVVATMAHTRYENGGAWVCWLSESCADTGHSKGKISGLY